MIPYDYITEWRSFAPWVNDIQVEQDLIITRAIIDAAQGGDKHERALLSSRFQKSCP